jgi:ketosteroid isomerase-like protein
MDRATENETMLRALYDALIRGDLAAVLASCHDDIDLEVHGPQSLPFAGRYRGRAALERFFAIVTETVEREPGVHIPELHDLIVQGDKAVARGFDRIRSRATGATLEGWWVQVLELRDGKVVLIREFLDTAAAHRAFSGEG